MPEQQPILGAVIVAAGGSTRMGVNKIYAEIANHPLLYHTVKSFETHPLVSDICLVVETTNLSKAEQIISKSQFKKVIKICEGGSSRQESVRIGLQHLPPTEFVAIHDGARPCVKHDTITNCIQLAQKYGNAIPGLPVTDTLKKTDPQNIIMTTVDRSHLWHVQTPQVFQWQAIHSAHESNMGEHTDDSSLLESLNINVHIAQGDPSNIKVTRPGDLGLAESILIRNRGE